MFILDEISRLISAGMDRKCAERVVVWYESIGDSDGLDSFVSSVEAGRDICNLQSKPSA